MTSQAQRAQQAPVEWTKTQVSVLGNRGRHDVPGYTTAAAPGLALAEIRTGVGDSLCPESPLYSVTHVESGLSIGDSLYLRPAAEDLLLRLAPFGDWTRPGVELLRDEALVAKATREVRRRRRAAR